MKNSQSNQASTTPRRDFLAAASTLSLGALGIPKPAIAQTNAPKPAPPGSTIEKLAIYPPLGISRVGNSNQYFHAPEVPGLPPLPDGEYKDNDRSIKKQAQRFRIYGFDAEGRVVREVTTGKDKIEWAVRVANTKAAWYGFNNPLDNGSLAPGLPGQLRNQFWTSDEDREKRLIIDGGETVISGPNVNPDGEDNRYRMEGRFWDRLDVKLGDLRTDEHGRLLVMPGDGVSQSAIPDNPIDNFSDNDGWHDDWCDGYVKATVKLDDGRQLPVDNGWIAVCGPNFAPEIDAFITLYDVIQNTTVEEQIDGARRPKGPLSFRKDIYPFFRRLGQMEYVASAAAMRQGWLRVGDFMDPDYIRQLANPAKQGEPNELRHHVFKQFRNPYSDEVEQYKMPYMLGDGINYDNSPAHWFLMPHHQYWILEQWAEGNFVDDFDDSGADAIKTLDDIPLAQQPEALTRAALDPCSGGAFHPGVELTWPLRHSELYCGAFRIAIGDRPSLLQDLGRLLTPEKAFEGDGDTPPPIGPQMPGDLTRWMGLPWQCDAFSCQFVQFSNDFPNAVWWPALLPIDILPEAYYRQLMREDLDPSARLGFFEGRVAWSRDVAGIGYHAEASYTDGLGRMVALWTRMGFVVSRPGPEDEAAPEQIHDELFVEIDRGSMDLETNAPPNLGIE